MNRQIISQLESILLVAAKPLSFRSLSKILEVSPEIIRESLEELQKQYRDESRGVELLLSEDEVTLVSSRENAALVKKFLKEETTELLTRPSVETLTIIAYRGPITKTEIEKIRGVNSSLILRNLMLRGLVSEEKGNAPLPVYSVTVEFLKYLGVGSAKELPDYLKLSITELV